MAMLVCCPCGQPIECDNLADIVTLPCPKCRRELTVEVDVPEPIRAILTIVEGPHWIGERFLLPVGEELRLGAGSGNWLSLDSPRLSPVHCSLKFTPRGEVLVEDLKSVDGTFVNNQRVLRGLLLPKQSLSIGDFKFRLSFASPAGSTIAPSVNPVAAPSVSTTPPILPALARVRPNSKLHSWFVAGRFGVARSLVLMTAWLMGAYHAAMFHARWQLRWPWSVVGGLVIVVSLITAGRRVALVHPRYKYASLFALVALATLDMIWMMPLSAIAALLLAACLTMLIMRIPDHWIAFGSTLIGAAAVFIVFIAAIRAFAAAPVQIVRP